MDSPRTGIKEENIRHIYHCSSRCFPVTLSQSHVADERRTVDTCHEVSDYRILAPEVLQYHCVAMTISIQQAVGAIRQCGVGDMCIFRGEMASEFDSLWSLEQLEVLAPESLMVKADAVGQGQ